MLRLGAERESLNIVDDQWGRPTAVDDLADAIFTVAPRLVSGDGTSGVLHFSDVGEPTTWRRFAEAIFARSAEWAGVKAKISPIPTDQYPTPARRPKNSIIDLGAVESAYGIAPRPWVDTLAATITEIRIARQHT